MEFKVEHLPNCKSTLRAEIPAEQVNKEKSKLVSYYAQHARIPGYRKGKVPASVIEKKFGKDIRERLRGDLIEKACREVAKVEDIDVLSISEVKNDLFHLDGTFTFDAEFVVSPQFELPAYEGIKVRIPKVVIQEEEVDKALNQWVERFAEFEPVEDRAIAMEDFAVLTYEANLAGKPLAEVAPETANYLASGKDRWVRMEEEGFLPGFCEKLVGIKKGEKKEVQVEVAEDYPVTEIAGKVVTFDLELVEIREQKLPELNDEIANKIEEGMTLEKLRAKTEESLQTQADREVDSIKRNMLLRHLHDEVDFELPEKVVEAETQERVNEIAMQAQREGATEEQMAEQKAEIIKYAGEQARLNVKSAFLLEEISKKENIEVENAEIARVATQLAAKQGTKPEKAIQEMQKDGTIRRIVTDLRTEKTLQHMLDKAVIEEVELEAWQKEQEEYEANKAAGVVGNAVAAAESTQEEVTDSQASQEEAAVEEATSPEKAKA